MTARSGPSHTPLPSPRGPLSRAVLDALHTGRPVDDVHAPEPCDAEAGDRALALWVLHELHHRGFDGVDPDAEWRPDLLAVRLRLEEHLERTWRARVADAGALEGQVPGTDPADDLASSFFAFCDLDDGSPSLARWVQREATEEKVLALLRQRSIYHVKEQDPAMWAVPRVDDEVKAHLVALASDEYGNGDPHDLHAQLWARGVTACGLDAGFAAYVDEALPEVLEQNALMTMLGLRRRLVPAALGHLAAFEVTSAVPSRRMVRGLQRLGMPEPMVAYYREHMEADAVHEQLAVRLLLGAHLAAHPEDRAEVFFGAACCLLAEGRTARAVLAHLGAGAPRAEAVA